MKTYQDFLQANDTESFIVDAINEHKMSEAYSTAVNAFLYYQHENPTINRVQKFIRNALGKEVPDTYSANSKISSNYFSYFVDQLTQYLLGNGVNFKDDETKSRLGEEFDERIQDAVTKSQICGVSFVFANFDRIEVFDITDFVPLYDEENGALMAGIRFWQISANKPMRITFYEEDGVTEYIRPAKGKMKVLKEKRSYIRNVEYSVADGIRIYDGGNYPSFPIVPMYFRNGKSRIVGNQNAIDAYDLMVSQLVNNVSDGSIIYWVLKNCGGMSDAEMEEYVTRVVRTHVSQAGDEDGASAEPKTVETPFQANEIALENLRQLLYDNFMALDVKQLSAGSVTATQIKASYEPLNQIADKLEYSVTKCIKGILYVLGIEDAPTYTRSAYANQMEEAEMLLSASGFLPREYIAEKLISVFGDIDRKDELLAKIADEESTRMNESPYAELSEEIVVGDE